MKPSVSTAPLLRRTDLVLEADPRRVAARLFLPGQEQSAPGSSRASGVVARCSAMTDLSVTVTLAELDASYQDRHPDLHALLQKNFDAIAHRVAEVADLTEDRRRLIGAYFTREVAIEAAALFNPSVVPHPVQDGGPGSLRFVMSARAVSEGHLSTVVFRSGTFTPSASDEVCVMDPAPQFVVSGECRSSPVPRERLRHQAGAPAAEDDTLDFVLSMLTAQIELSGLDAATDELRQQALTRSDVDATIESLRHTVAASYEVTFPQPSLLSDRTLFPEADAESHGMEDARLVRLTRLDGSVSYAATYTGYNGTQVVSRRLETDDFRTFRSTPLTGLAAENKGMALFPRPVGGRYLALSRWDRENNAIASSADGHHWDEVAELQVPTEPWELIQLGNCGPPMETDAGWLVLTHGVGPMRGYALGALLLDTDDPTRVVGRLTEPLLQPDGDEREGYVPNVVYSCGALIHEQTLLLPYGASDTSIRFGLVDVPDLLERLVSH
jgi:predicted GH43/DUF377 family glycosyl hydrolase